MIIDYKAVLKRLIFTERKTSKENEMITKLTQWDDQNFKKQCKEVWNI